MHYELGKQQSITMHPTSRNPSAARGRRLDRYTCANDGATSARCEACSSACRRHATRRLEDAEDHRYAERKLEANRGAARVDSARTHVAVRR